jgi:hypothetical protein
MTYEIELPKKLPLDTIVQGQVIHRISSASFADDAFNDYSSVKFDSNNKPFEEIKMKNGTKMKVDAFWYRFSPFSVNGKKAVPATYLGKTEHVAIAETLIRPYIQGGPSLALQSLENKRMIQLKVTKDMRLAALFPENFDDKTFKIIDLENLTTGTDQYENSEVFARAIYEHKDNVDGIIWYSKRSDEHISIVLFDRAIDKLKLDPDKPGEDLLTSNRLLKTIGSLCTKYNRDIQDDLRCKIDAA